MLNDFRLEAGQFSQSFEALELTGDDASTFLQKQSTYNIEKLDVGFFHLISFLDPQGRIEFYCWCLRYSKSFILLIPRLQKQKAVERINKFLVSEDVEINELGLQNWSVALGPATTHLMGLRGTFFEEDALLQQEANFINLPVIPEGVIEQWRNLNGWPDLTGAGFNSELINNLRLFDLSVSDNKGCYPGQETVSKIATRRGAAFSPVLIEIVHPASAGILTSHDKKIGEAKASYEWKGKHYLSASMLRDFRVDGLKINFSLNGINEVGHIRYFPLLPGSSKEKAQELFYEAIDHFGKDRTDEAEKLLRHALKLDTNFADAYESLGVILGRQERFLEAIEIMQTLTKVDPTSVLAHTNMSLYLMRLGKIEEAEEQKSTATVKSFQKFGAEAQEKERLKSESVAKESEWSKRESMFKQVLEIDEEDSLANFGLGTIAVERQNWTDAAHFLEKVLASDPKYSVAYLALGRAYLGLGLKEKAKDIWKKGIEVAAAKGDLMPANQMQSEVERI